MPLIQIPEDQAAALQAKAAAQGLTLEGWLRKQAEEPTAPETPAQPRARRHIGDVIRERMSKVPPEIVATMPKDGAAQHDHYIYGLPKREA